MNRAPIFSIAGLLLALTPAVQATSQPDSRALELRAYTATENNNQKMDARFRDHTITLIKWQGKPSLAYFHFAEGQASGDSDFQGFRTEWPTARMASEALAGGPLAIKGGVSTDFLPVR